MTRPGPTPGPAPARRDPAAVIYAAHVEELRTSIATRLRRVCADLSDEQFAQLVQDIAAVTLLYEDRGRVDDRAASHPHQARQCPHAKSS